MRLAFICTGPSRGWDPFCNGDQFAALAVGGVIVGVALTYLMSRRGEWDLAMLALVGLSTVILSVVTVVVIGLAL